MNGKSLRYLLLLALCLVVRDANAQTPSWSADVAPILFNKCASCHRPTGIAPFSLLNYADAATNGPAIKHAVSMGHMPPWPPDPKYTRLAHERLLSPDEKSKIINWVDANVPQGDPNLAPPQPVFSTTGDLPGTPDLVSQIPTFTSIASGADNYRCFVIDPNLSANKFITALEALPGNRSIVHHVLVFADTTGICENMDALDPGPGYTSFGGVGTDDAILLGGWVPGGAPLQFPAGFGVGLPQNAKIVLQVHYPAGSAGQVDSTKVRFFFASGPVRPVIISPVLNHDLNISPALHIPANTVKTFSEQFAVPPGYDVSVLGVLPHMHLIGRNIKSFAVKNTDTTKFVSIPDWHFHWQGIYMLRNLVRVTGGATLYAEAMYDNTTNNPYNPNNPPQDVHAGEATTDEMMLVFFLFTGYMPGDESITIDNTPLVPLRTQGSPYYTGQMLLAPYPNPANGRLYVKSHFDAPAKGMLELTGMDGKVARVFDAKLALPAGYSVREYDVSSVPAGTYLLRLKTDKEMLTQKVVISH